MTQPRSSTVFGRRREPHTIIIARGDDIRHFTVRPWVMALVGCVFSAIAIGYLLATSYLVLRDDLIGATVARQARLQQAYEDRISALRAQVDRITSRQLLDQQLMENKVAELLDRQRELTSRDGRLKPLLKRAGLSASQAPLPVLAPAPASKPERRADAATIDSSLLARIGIGRDTSAPDLSSADRADRLFVEINKALRSIEAEQVDNIRSLTENAYQTAETIKGALESAGLEVAADFGESNAGGPLIALDDPTHFEAGVEELDDALAALDGLRDAAKRLPIANPAPGAPVSSSFGARKDPLLGTAAFHSGIDFRSSSGVPVRATGKGTVVKAGWNGGYGRMVEVDHGDGLVTRYAHMSAISVAVGDPVAVGSEVGKVGSTGRSTGSHLHYEVRRNGEALNPVRFLKVGKKIAGLL